MILDANVIWKDLEILTVHCTQREMIHHFISCNNFMLLKLK